MITTEDEARSWFRDSIGLDSTAIGRLETLAELLRTENMRQNLISRASADTLWVRHFADSAQLLIVPRGANGSGTWLDLGTGAGFPGLIVAICRPDIHVHMVDSRRLRADWLQRATSALQLSNAQTVLALVEHLPTRTFDTISARAFARLETLIELSARFSTPDTDWMLPKGAKAAQELQMLSGRWKHLFHVEQSITDPNAGIITGRLLSSATDEIEPTVPKGRP